MMESLANDIRKEMVRAISDFNMIESHDRLMVCVSGGKDSSVLLSLLLEIQRRSERKFSVEAVMLDQKQPGFQVSERHFQLLRGAYLHARDSSH